MEEEIPCQPTNRAPQLKSPTPIPLRLEGSLPQLTPSPPPTPQSIPHLNLPGELSHSLNGPTPHPPFQQGIDIIEMLLWLNEAGEGLQDKVLLEWALDMLCSPEGWRWLWSPGPVPTQPPFLINPPPHLPSPIAPSANLWSTYDLNALSTSAPSADGPLLDILNEPALCEPVPSAENSVMWAPVAQPQLQLTPLQFFPEWATLEGFESVSQGYKGGNIMVERTPTSFSPFSPVDCTLISHFSFNDFIALASPDLALDPDAKT